MEVEPLVKETKEKEEKSSNVRESQIEAGQVESASSASAGKKPSILRRVEKPPLSPALEMLRWQSRGHS